MARDKHPGQVNGVEDKPLEPLTPIFVLGSSLASLAGMAKGQFYDLIHPFNKMKFQPFL
jgi:hypothetical protein